MDLVRLYGRFHGETEGLVRDMKQAKSLADKHTESWEHSQVYIRAQQMIIIRAVDSWGKYCRSIILESCYATPKTESGTVVTRAAGILSRSDALAKVSQRYYRPPHREPSWHVPSEAIGAARYLGINNFTSVSLALGSTPNPIDDLRILRNSLAHRSMHAINRMNQVILNYGYKGLDAQEFLTMTKLPGILIFEDWMMTIRGIARAAIH